MSEGEEKPTDRKRLNSSLGWLAQSTSQPKKRKQIEGVSAASLVALKSQLAKNREDVNVSGLRHPTNARTQPHGGGGSVAALLHKKNPGVAERDRIDRLSVKTNTDRLSESRAALERKAALYDRLSSGHTLDEEEAARYEVDFQMKEGDRTRRGHGEKGSGNTREQGQEHYRHQPHSYQHNSIATGIDTTQAAVYTTTGALQSADMKREQERRAWEESIQQESAIAEIADQRREMIEQLERQTREGRDRAAITRQERLHAENRKRERLKAEFLKKKLEAAKTKAAAEGW